jgi:hypothetical protein
MSQTAIAAALMMLYAAPVASAANAAATAENAAVSAEKSAELPTWLGTGQWVAPPRRAPLADPPWSSRPSS